jgi:predicted transcriptional regulator
VENVEIKWSLKIGSYRGIPVSSATLSEYYALYSTDKLSRSIELILARSQQDFPVVDNGKIVDILERKDLMHTLAKHDQDYPVENVMQKEFESVDVS